MSAQSLLRAALLLFEALMLMGASWLAWRLLAHPLRCWEWLLAREARKGRPSGPGPSEGVRRWTARLMGLFCALQALQALWVLLHAARALR